MGIKKVSIDLINRANARKSITPEYIVFRENKPLALRNHVKSRSAVNNEKVCMNEMMLLMDCMSKYNQDKTMCSKELATFNKCLSASKEKYLNVKNKGEIQVGQKVRLPSNQMHDYMKKFPQSTRTHVMYIDPQYTSKDK